MLTSLSNETTSAGKLDETATGLQKSYLEYLQSVSNKNRHNAAVIVSYVTNER